MRVDIGVRMLGLLVLAAGCGSSGLDGRYYNSVTGKFAMELKGGKVVEAQGMPSDPMTYQVRGDTVFIMEGKGMAEGLYFIRLPNGDLSLEPLGILTRNRPD